MVATIVVIQGEIVAVVVRTQVVVKNSVNVTTVVDKIIHLIIVRSTKNHNRLRL